MSKVIFRNATIINEGTSKIADLLVVNERIEKIDSCISVDGKVKEIDCTGLYLIPGAIDDQVHFREPGLTHKAELATESRAAVAGGVTSFMEMPNTVPNTLNQELLEQKYQRASQVSTANYSFFMGASNDNYDEVMRTNGREVCGIKIFMGSSTGNMLVDNTQTLERLFSNVPLLIATHCEDEATVRKNLELFKEKYDTNIPIEAHPFIRSEEACSLSSSSAVAMAKKFGTRLHVLHISTGIETHLFENKLPVFEKKITAEACIHHLWFSSDDYTSKGNFIKWNPAIKTKEDRNELWKALLDDRIDVIATDHAPHTIEEKNQDYLSAPSGGPLIQHSVIAMFEKSKEGLISKERVVEKMCHAVSDCFKLVDRGYIREGYFADLVLINPNVPTEVDTFSLYTKCQWSPFLNEQFSHSIESTFVNGKQVYSRQLGIHANCIGKRLTFKIM
jgi:dihydroorotase